LLPIVESQPEGVPAEAPELLEPLELPELPELLEPLELLERPPLELELPPWVAPELDDPLELPDPPELPGAPPSSSPDGLELPHAFPHTTMPAPMSAVTKPLERRRNNFMHSVCIGLPLHQSPASTPASPYPAVPGPCPSIGCGFAASPVRVVQGEDAPRASSMHGGRSSPL
jgi:hypothetical protein